VERFGSDNPDGAENQQERLVSIGWVLGFVDGEGCFSVGFVRQSGGLGRRGYRTGWQVAHEFAVTQGASSTGCLHELREFFGVGGVIVNRRHDNHREPLQRFVVRRRADLLGRIIPFFEQYALRSAKRADFEKFAQVVWMVDNGCHLTHAGMVEIAEIAQTMNRQKDRSELIRILRGHTPEIRDTGS
jgi:LAGLIDADG DNA endonuclease family protein